jgi:ABC-type sugar transport system ATPase subunit
MRVELANLYNRLGTTMIYVTHDQVEAMTMATRITVLNAGNIEQVGTPYELYNFPRNRFVATFIGSPKMNMLAASDGGTADFGKLEMPATVSHVGIRPEHLVLGGGGAEGKVTLVEYLGSEIFVHLALPSGQQLLAQADGKAQFKMGDTARVSFDAKAAHYFDSAGKRVALYDAVAA